MRYNKYNKNKEGNIMKNIHDMSDRELIDYQYEQQEIMQRADNPFAPNKNVTTEQRDAALETLHDIRIEGWRRGWNGVPVEENRAEYERHVARNIQRVDAAKATGKAPAIYAKMNMLRTSEDRLFWIDGRFN